MKLGRFRVNAHYQSADRKLILSKRADNYLKALCDKQGAWVIAMLRNTN